MDLVQAEAVAAGKGVVLHVQQANPARRLYERLGFVDAGTSGLHTELRWAP